ncbi:MAG: c-type cytochrome [Rhodanobacteraceae bacterium]
MRSSSIIQAAACAAACLFACVAGAAIAAAGTYAPQDAPFRAAEAWAFPVFPPPPDPHAPKPDSSRALHVAGSPVTYTQAQLDGMDDADWFPQDHPPAPHIVKLGRKPARPCAECHTISGTGVPATADLDSLPKAYILEQIAAFRAGERGMGGPATAHDMVDEARALTSSDEKQAIDYFSATKFFPRVHVVETATVPKTHWKSFVLKPDKSGAREPIGERIIETPVDFNDYSLSDGRVGYVAYVPPGSIEAGAKIAAHGVGAAPACESCHGARLQGVGDIPYLAGRSPTYIARELILFRLGKRTNSGAVPMRTEVSHLTLKDMIDVAAYAGSRGS